MQHLIFSEDFTRGHHKRFAIIQFGKCAFAARLVLIDGLRCGVLPILAPLACENRKPLCMPATRQEIEVAFARILCRHYQVDCFEMLLAVTPLARLKPASVTVT